MQVINQSSVSKVTPVIEKESYPQIGYSWYVVGVFTIAYVFSFLDRQILSLLVGPIRRDLDISDTQMSLLMSLSFALFYTLFGILFGRLADSKSRRTIIAIGVAFWSVMTAGCGLATNFRHFLMLRMGVGLGEATLSPSAYSLISDYFPKENRATAISVYSMGIYIGVGLALVLGGLVVKFASAQGSLEIPVIGLIRPWQVVFLILGLSGIIFALFTYTVEEPIRKGIRMMKATDGRTKVAHVPVHEVIAYIGENRSTFLCHNIGFGLLALAGYASIAWIPTFFIRKYGWTGAQAGMVYGTIMTIFGTLGIVTGGRLSDWLTRYGYRDSNMRVALLGVIGLIPFCMVYPIMPKAYLAAALLVPKVFLSSMPFGVAAAAIQEMMPNEMRGQASAIYLFVISLIGLGLGPTAVAMMTDYVFHDDNAINYSLLVVTTLAHLGSAVLLWIGLKPFLRSLDCLNDWTRAHAT